MKIRLLGILLILYSVGGSAATATTNASSKAQLYRIISDFDVTKSSEEFRISVTNVNGDRISEFPVVKAEETHSFEKYSFHNPFIKASVESLQIYDLYVFKDLKATFLDSKNFSSLEDSLSNMEFNVSVLIERASNKTIKSKTDLYMNNQLIASGDIEDNAVLKLTNDKSVADGLKIKTLRVRSNLMASHKRTFELALQGIQSNRPVEQIMRLSLNNVSKVPIPENQKSDENLENLEDNTQNNFEEKTVE